MNNKVNNTIRRQLTLFVETPYSKAIQQIRSKYNPVQSALINSHVTLCREDEIENLEAVINNLENLRDKSILIHFSKVERFAEGKGVLIPAAPGNHSFHQLRKTILHGINQNPGLHQPHITLLHPRNSTCTDAVFEVIQQVNFPVSIIFNTISLVEQKGDSPWKVLQEFELGKEMQDG